MDLITFEVTLLEGQEEHIEVVYATSWEHLLHMIQPVKDNVVKLELISC